LQAGGPKKLFEKLKEAYEAEKFQWAVQLSDALLEIGKFEREAKVAITETPKHKSRPIPTPETDNFCSLVPMQDNNLICH
jgi:hypothetical protein